MSSENERDDASPTNPFTSFDELLPTGGDGLVQVISGIYSISLPIVGMSVGEARRRIKEMMWIHSDSVPVIDGSRVGDDTVLREGQVLAFVRPAGEIC
jgi:hypothetical protein